MSIVFTNNDKVGILTELGNFIIIRTDDIRAIGRVARGVKAITLNDGDYVISAHTIPENTTHLASISGNGLFKQTSISEFGVQGRGTKGNKIQKLNDGDWMADFYPVIAGAKDVLVASTSSSIKLTTNDIPLFSKGALGNKSIKMDAKSNVVGIFIY